jgi:hypothetical protein
MSAPVTRRSLDGGFTLDTRVRRRRVPAVALAALLLPIAGCAAPTQGSASAPAPVASATPSGAFGGSVQFTSDGTPARTVVDAVADGASVSGTAVTEFGAGITHTVQLACASRIGDTWAVGGTTEQTTLHDGVVGDWSAVIVKDGSPQQIGIWVSDPKSEGIDCDGWLAATDFTTLPPEALQAVESGALVPPAAP